MKRAIVIAIGLAALCLWVSSDIWARGGRGGGGRGGGGRAGGGMGGGRGPAVGGPSRGGVSGRINYNSGYSGGYRGGYAAGRTPSMSRSTGVPSSLSRPTGGSYASRTPNTRPSYGKLPTPSFIPGAGSSSRPGAGTIASRPGGPRPGGSARPTTSVRPSAGTLPAGGGLPPRRDLPNYVDLPTGGGGLAGVKLPTSLPIGTGTGLAGVLLPGGAAAEFLHDRPASDFTGIGNRPGKLPASAGRPGLPSDRPLRPGDGELAQHRPNRIEDRKQWKDWREDHRDGILRYWRNNRDDDEWYGDEWWLYHHLQKVYAPNFNYWAEPAWPAVTNWVDPSWREPVYYYYGDNVYYQDGSVYYGDQPVATDDEYAQQAEAIATSGPKTKPTENDWMPLGVFALTSDGKPTGAEPTMFLQLAVSKQGVINGTFQNTSTETVQAVEGMVDKQTQRAAWTGAGKIRPLMETGIYNLTEESTPALVHFADGTTQQWLMVRVDEPEPAAGAEKSATSATR